MRDQEPTAEGLRFIFGADGKSMRYSYGAGLDGDEIATAI
jgi:hypothetical protein